MMMPQEIEFTILSFASLFVIVDPIGTVPTFLTMVEGNTRADRLRMVKIASLAVCLVLILVSFFGESIFTKFGLTLPALEIAGGIVLVIVALDMLQARRTAVKETREESDAGVAKEDIAITPLAIPLLAGPGAITTVILLASKAETIAEHFILIGSIIAVSLATFLILRFAAVKSSAFGIIPVKILTRLMGLVLLAIAVQFILNGISSTYLLK